MFVYHMVFCENDLAKIRLIKCARSSSLCNHIWYSYSRKTQCLVKIFPIFPKLDVEHIFACTYQKHNSAIILKFQVEKIDTKGFSTVLVSTGTPGSDNKMLAESTFGNDIKSKMAAKSHNTPC